MASSSSDNNSRKQSSIVMKLFTCNRCKHSFLNERDFLEHMIKEEEEKTDSEPICLRCKRRFKNYCAYCYLNFLSMQQPPPPIPPPPLHPTVTVKEEETTEDSCIVLPNIVNEVETFNEPSTSTHKHKKHGKIPKQKAHYSHAPHPYHHDEEQSNLKAEIKLIMILHECDSNIREMKPLKSKQICPICDKMCDRERGQDIRGHARVHGTVFLKYSQERLYRAI